MSDNPLVAPLVDADTLREWLDSDRRTVVIDVRWRLGGPSLREDYHARHVPGALFVEFDIDICGPPGARGRHPLPDPAHLQATLRRLGIRDGSRVVVYDGGDALAAARTWWTLRWAGLSQVYVLDGGYPAWTGEVSTDVGVPVPGDVLVRPGGMPALDAAGAAELARDGVLLDVRTPERYRGETEPIDPVAGRIPGAVNLPGAELDGGRFAAAATLRERYAAAGATGDVPTGAYCGSGVTAARTALGMTVAGLRPALYVGSWSEWITDPARPVATGDPGPPAH
ncbi:MAG: sulfurtransferase [Micromonosporaceae bacterium]